MQFQVFTQLYFLVQYAVVAVLLVIIAAMLVRMILNYTDPNPFGNLGKFSYWIKTKTDPLVYPVSGWLALGRFDTRLAPFLTILLACLFGYFMLQAFKTITYTLDGAITSLTTGRFVALVGFLIYGILGMLSLMIFVRLLLTWVFVYGNKFTRLLGRFTDPILLPFRRLIPPIGGVLDISPMVALFLISLFQSAVAGTLIATGR